MPSKRQRDHYLVGVTAFGPFKSHASNPSTKVKDAIASSIDHEGGLPIRVIKCHHNFQNLLSDMDDVPGLWEGSASAWNPESKSGETVHIDAMIHIGMRDSDPRWSVEKRARRDGYEFDGEDGISLPKNNGGQGGYFEGLPEVLKPMYDMEAIDDRIERELPDVPMHTSGDAGLLFCEFMMYASLATLYKRKEPARMAFLHVPKSDEPEDIEKGAKVAMCLLRAMIDTQIELDKIPDVVSDEPKRTCSMQ